ncbi:MAG: hypothetical protein VR75_18155 [Hyphomonadaceae bacterium BRH_c29]|nr:MAG: hypothetical protein VR75_18155 [Hyphomonadaceae bacterium BRH_c29]
MLAASQTIVVAITRPNVCTLTQLFAEYALEQKHLIAACAYIQRVLDYFDLDCDPPIGDGGLEDRRVLKRRSRQDEVETRARALIAAGESYKIEFKSTISINTQKKLHNPTLTARDCVDERLRLKVAKEIAALMNADGGTILFGVQDDRELYGCDEDFEAFPAGGSDSDKADQLLKQLVDRYFFEATAVFRHLKIDSVRLEGVALVVVEVAARDFLSFLKKVEGTPLFLRSGTHAIPIEINEIEKYFQVTRRGAVNH